MQRIRDRIDEETKGAAGEQQIADKLPCSASAVVVMLGPPLQHLTPALPGATSCSVNTACIRPDSPCTPYQPDHAHCAAEEQLAAAEEEEM